MVIITGGSWSAPSGTGKKKKKHGDAGTPNAPGGEGTGAEGRAMFDERQTRVSYSNERLNPNSKYNKNKENFESEVNPEVRKKFEEKYGEGATFGKDGKGYADYEAYIQEKKQELKSPLDYVPIAGPLARNIKLLKDKDLRTITSFKDILINQGLLVGETALLAGGVAALAHVGPFAAQAATGAFGKGAAGYAGVHGLLPKAAATGAAAKELVPGLSSLFASTAGKTILGMSIPKVTVGIAGALAGGDFITNWMAVDNALGQLNILSRDISENMGSMSPEERQSAQRAAEEINTLVQIAENKVKTSAFINPTVWPFAKMWLAELKVAETARTYYLEQIKNYSPYTDQWSLESQRARGYMQ
jgi:hypothetical protein